jgi:NAD(P)-dependent dehydrogenase (short-subunit alcohol dehydrogenase family)
VAKRLASEGGWLVVNGRSASSLNDTVDAITRQGGQAIACAGSVSDYDAAAALVQTCVAEYGGIDVLINCAGIAEPYGTSILNIDPEDWQELIDVHLHGTFNTCREAAPIMARQGGGTIINTSSHAFTGMYGGTGYAAGKGATNSLSFAMAADLQAHNINVNVICPGAKTRLSTGADFIDKIENLHREGMLSDERRLSALNPASPDYVAALYAVLASDLAKDVTGQVYWGSGGHIGRFLETGQEVLAVMDASNQPPWETQALAEQLGFGPGQR